MTPRQLCEFYSIEPCIWRPEWQLRNETKQMHSIAFSVAGGFIEFENYSINRMKLKLSTSIGVNEINKIFKYSIVLRLLILSWVEAAYSQWAPFLHPTSDFLLNYEIESTLEQEELNADSYQCRISIHSNIFNIQWDIERNLFLCCIFDGRIYAWVCCSKECIAFLQY